MLCLVSTHEIKVKILLSNFGAHNLPYLRNLKPWLQRSKCNLDICHVISLFYIHWNGSWKKKFWKAIRCLILFIFLNKQTPLVFHIIHKKPSTFQGVTFRKNFMSYGVLNLLINWKSKRFKNLYVSTIHMFIFWMRHAW